jgi:hypothetical protein
MTPRSLTGGARPNTGQHRRPVPAASHAPAHCDQRALYQKVEHILDFRASITENYGYTKIVTTGRPGGHEAQEDSGRCAATLLESEAPTQIAG